MGVDRQGWKALLPQRGDQGIGRARLEARQDGFRLTEARGLKWHSVSAAVRRGFCVECGSSVLFDETADPKMSICAGTLDSPTGLREKAHIFVASKGDYYEVSGDLPRYDTLPPR